MNKIKLEIIYNAIIHSKADIETIRWKLGKEIRKENQEVRIIVEVSRELDKGKRR